MRKLSFDPPWTIFGHSKKFFGWDQVERVRGGDTFVAGHKIGQVFAKRVTVLPVKLDVTFLNVQTSSTARFSLIVGTMKDQLLFAKLWKTKQFALEHDSNKPRQKLAINFRLFRNHSLEIHPERVVAVRFGHCTAKKQDWKNLIGKKSEWWHERNKWRANQNNDNR